MVFQQPVASLRYLFTNTLTQDFNKSGKNFQMRKNRFFSSLAHNNLIQYDLSQLPVLLDPILPASQLDHRLQMKSLGKTRSNEEKNSNPIPETVTSVMFLHFVWVIRSIFRSSPIKIVETFHIHTTREMKNFIPDSMV